MKILYLTFIDFNGAASSGSQLRPRKMLEALREVADEVRCSDGAQNDRKARIKAYRTVKAWIKDWHPDICYIEPPSGPLFYPCDRKLIREIYKQGIPIGLFYRDAYWRFPESISDINVKKNLKQRAKDLLIKIMQQSDWRLFKRCCRVLYFPTELMASYFDCARAEALPPGCDILVKSNVRHDSIPRAVFVGAATERYGMPLVLSAGEIVNRNKICIKICIVCQKESWQSFLVKHPEYNRNIPWLEVHHINAGPELNAVLEESTFALIPLKKNPYHDFAFPVKAGDYLSHLLPIVSTNCEEIAHFIRENGIGLVASDDKDSFAAAMREISENKDLFRTITECCVLAREQNTWVRRAEKVVSDLSGGVSSD